MLNPCKLPEISSDQATQRRFQRLFKLAHARGFPTDAGENPKSIFYCQVTGQSFHRVKRGSIYNWPRNGERPTTHIIRAYNRFEFYYPSDRISKSVLDILLTGLPHDVEKQWDSVQASARCARLYAAIIITISGFSLSQGIANALSKRVWIENDEQLNEVDWVNIAFTKAMKTEGKAWFNEINNLRRIKGHSLDYAAFAICINWLNPNCPLWLMGPQAMLEACKVLMPCVSWTENVLKKRLRYLGLRSYPKCITRIKVRDGKIQFFEVLKDVLQRCKYPNHPKEVAISKDAAIITPCIEFEYLFDYQVPEWSSEPGATFARLKADKVKR